MVMCMLYCLEQDWEQVKIATRAQSLDQYEVAKWPNWSWCTCCFFRKINADSSFSVDLFLSTDLEGLFLIQGKVVQFLEHSHN